MLARAEFGCPSCGCWVASVVPGPDGVNICEPCALKLARAIVRRKKNAPRAMAVPKGKRR